MLSDLLCRGAAHNVSSPMFHLRMQRISRTAGGSAFAGINLQRGQGPARARQGLAKSVAWDGEGATCLMEVSAAGAADDAGARAVARAVSASSLVKAAVFGHDPNWGRIACAAGCAPGRTCRPPSRCALALSGHGRCVGLQAWPVRVARVAGRTRRRAARPNPARCLARRAPATRAVRAQTRWPAGHAALP